MPAQVQFNVSSAILAEIPQMRAYARLMTNDRSKADQAVEEALKSLSVTEIRCCERSQVRVPLFEILRGFLARDQRPAFNQAGPNTYISFSSSLALASGRNNEQQTVTDTGFALLKLSFEEREALILSAAAGFSDLDIAKICGCKEENIRARVIHGRSRLSGLLRIEFSDDLDQATAHEGI